MHDIGQITNRLNVLYMSGLYVGEGVCPKYRSSTIATMVFVRSASNLKQVTHLKAKTKFDGQ